MKKLLLIVGLTVISLGGCYVAPYGGHDDGYRRDRDHREDRDHKRDHDEHDGGRGGEHGDSDGYH